MLGGGKSGPEIGLGKVNQRSSSFPATDPTPGKVLEYFFQYKHLNLIFFISIFVNISSVSYIDVLKSENNKKELDSLPCSSLGATAESKRVSELERTVFILKRVVEKLQAENKRLLTGKRPLSDRSVSSINDSNMEERK